MSLVNFQFSQLEVVAQITANAPVENYDTQCSKPAYIIYTEYTILFILMMISVLCHSQSVHTVILPFTNGNVELILAPIGTWECDTIQDVSESIFGKSNCLSSPHI